MGNRRIREVIKAANERAHRAYLPGDLTTSQYELALEYFNGMCAYCGDRPAQILEHFVPVAQGGSTSVLNCLPSCSDCNARKSDISPESEQGLRVLGEIMHDRLMRYFMLMHRIERTKEAPHKAQEVEVPIASSMTKIDRTDKKLLMLRAAAYALLTAEPGMGSKRLSALLGCRYETALSLCNSWKRLHSTSQPSEQTPVGNDKAQEIIKEASAFALLDAYPNMSRTELRRWMACRQTTANALHDKWLIRKQSA